MQEKTTSETRPMVLFWHAWPRSQSSYLHYAAKFRLTLISWLVTFAEEGLWRRMLNFSAGRLHCLELKRKKREASLSFQ